MTQSNGSWMEPEKWPDLPKSGRWVLRLFVMLTFGIIAFSIARFIFTLIDPVARNQLNFNDVPIVASTEVKLSADAIYETAWFSEDEIVIIGEFPPTANTPRHQIKTYNKTTEALTAYTSIELNSLCLNSTFNPLQFDSNRTIEGDLVFYGICKKHNSSAVREIFVNRFVFQNDEAKFLRWHRFLDSNFPSNGPKSLNSRKIYEFAIHPSQESMAYIDRFLGTSIVNFRSNISKHFNESNGYKFVSGSIVAWSPNGETLASTAFIGNVRLIERYEPNSIQLLDINEDDDYQIELSPVYNVHNLAWVGDHLTFSGNYQALEGGWRLDSDRNRLWYYDLLLPENREREREYDIDFSPTGNWALAVSKETGADDPSFYLSVIEYVEIE